MATREDTTPADSQLAESPPDPYVATARAVLTDLFGPPLERTFAVRFWDGSLDVPVGGSMQSHRKPAFTLVLRRPEALRRMLLPPTSRSLGEAYVRNDIDVEGDIEAASSAAERIFRTLRSPRTTWRWARHLLSLPSADTPHTAASARNGRRSGVKHSPARDMEAIRFHYDVGNEFYALWLDRHMQYSAAWFDRDDQTLDTAQEAKLDRICRLLDLQPGERLLDIGCGWGGLIRFAAGNYGVSASGITLSERQAQWAREHIARDGLDDRCTVEIRDYRNIPSGTRFDKAVSVGMIEHVGASRLTTYFRDIFRLLEPGGGFLNSGIILLDAPRSLLAGIMRKWGRRWTSFVDSYVFPDGELVSPAATLSPAEAAGFELRHLDSLREDYALTLRHWVDRLEAQRQEAKALVGEEAYRIWRLYMSGAAHAFAAGDLGVIQALFARPDENGGVRLPPRGWEGVCAAKESNLQPTG